MNDDRTKNDTVFEYIPKKLCTICRYLYVYRSLNGTRV